MQWLVDLIIEAIGIPPTFIDRGDPAAWDYAAGDFTKDGNWHELDVSAIVPAGATAVLLKYEFQGVAVDTTFEFRKDGNANAYNTAKIRAVIAGVVHYCDCVCPISTDRKLEYRQTGNPIININVVIKGWWL